MKKFFIGLALLHTICFSAQAQQPVATDHTGKSQMAVKIVEEKNDLLFVRIFYKHSPEGKAKMMVADENGEVLYTEKITDANYVKLIRFSTEELPGGVNISFIENGTVIKACNVNVHYVKTYELQEIAKH